MNGRESGPNWLIYCSILCNYHMCGCIVIDSSTYLRRIGWHQYMFADDLHSRLDFHLLGNKYTPAVYTVNLTYLFINQIILF